MELKVQHFLRNGGSLDDLRLPPYEITVKERGNLVCLKYTQGRSDDFCEIVKECRGLILEKDTWDVVCFPFKRFYNYGQPAAATLQDPVRVFQKVDGSLCKIYNYNEEWFLASSGTIDAREVEIDSRNKSINFFELFCKALETYGMTWETFTQGLIPRHTYMYELCTPDNIVVIPHEKYEIYYLGERDNKTFQEYYHHDMGVSRVGTYHFQSLNDVLDAAQELPLTEEGFVVVDKNWNRVKIKNPAYLHAHYLHHNGAPNFLHILLEKEQSEFLTYFPHYKDTIAALEDKIRTWAANIQVECEQMFASHSGLSDSEFGRTISSTSISPISKSFIFFKKKRPTASFSNFVSGWDESAWERNLKKEGIL